MDAIEHSLAEWKASLCQSIPLAGLLSRNAVAYRWKAPFRCFMLHEVVCWRVHDLMTQSYALHRLGHALGARILLRSGFESLATLVYLNQLTQQVLEGKLSFHVFSARTSALLLGSRNDTTELKSINILTVLEKCDKRYPGLSKLYADLSESAHPSYEGLCKGYSTTKYSEYETTFSNRWAELYGERHFELMERCIEIFYHEYNDVWTDLIEKLEIWIEANNTELEANKDMPPLGE